MRKSESIEQSYVGPLSLKVMEMQRLRIETPGDGDDLRIEPDPEGEFVRADEAQAEISKLEKQVKKLSGQVRRLRSCLPVR